MSETDKKSGRDWEDENTTSVGTFPDSIGVEYWIDQNEYSNAGYMQCRTNEGCTYVHLQNLFQQRSGYIAAQS